MCYLYLSLSLPLSRSLFIYRCSSLSLYIYISLSLSLYLSLSLSLSRHCNANNAKKKQCRARAQSVWPLPATGKGTLPQKGAQARDGQGHIKLRAPCPRRARTPLFGRVPLPAEGKGTFYCHPCPTNKCPSDVEKRQESTRVEVQTCLLSHRRQHECDCVTD